MSTCTKCGSTIEEGHRFCKSCGTSVDPSSLRSPESASRANATQNDLALFVGKNSDKYLSRFRKFDNNGQDAFAVTWHWPAFFFSFWWALYRKMYGWAILVLFISCVPYVGLLMMVGFGISANYFYYRRAKRLVTELKAGPGTDIDKAAAIARAGGVNNVAVVVAPILIIAVIGILAAIAIPQFVMYRQKAYEAKTQQEILQACSVGTAFFASHPEKNEVEPDDLLYNGLVRTAEVDMMLLDGRKEYFSIKARHVKGKKTYYTDAQCTLRVEEDVLPGKPVYQPEKKAIKGDKQKYQF